jgi:hypothetical protein
LITLITGLPDNVVGAEASGKVTDDDYKNVLIPAVERANEKHEKIRLLYVLGAGFEDYDAGAMWDDAKVGLSHFGAWERIAVVTDHSVYRAMIKAFGFAMPGEVKVYPLNELDQAKAWVTA